MVDASESRPGKARLQTNAEKAIRDQAQLWGPAQRAAPLAWPGGEVRQAHRCRRGALAREVHKTGDHPTRDRASGRPSPPRRAWGHDGRRELPRISPPERLALPM